MPPAQPNALVVQWLARSSHALICTGPPAPATGLRWCSDERDATLRRGSSTAGPAVSEAARKQSIDPGGRTAVGAITTRRRCSPGWVASVVFRRSLRCDGQSRWTEQHERYLIARVNEG